MPNYLAHQQFFNDTGGTCDDLHIKLEPAGVDIDRVHSLGLSFTDIYIVNDFLTHNTTEIHLAGGFVDDGELQTITFITHGSETPKIKEWFWTRIDYDKPAIPYTPGTGIPPKWGPDIWDQIGPTHITPTNVLPVAPFPAGGMIYATYNDFINMTGDHATDLEIYFVEPDVKITPSSPPWPAYPAPYNFDTVSYENCPPDMGGGVGTMVRLEGGTGIPSGEGIELDFASNYSGPITIKYRWSFPNYFSPDQDGCCPDAEPWDPWPDEKEKEKKKKEKKPVWGAIGGGRTPTWGAIGLLANTSRKILPLVGNTKYRSEREASSLTIKTKVNSFKNVDFGNNQRRNQRDNHSMNYYPFRFYQQNDYRSFLDILPKKMNKGNTNYSHQERNRH